MRELKRIGIIANLGKPQAHATVDKLAAWLHAQAREVIGPPSLRPLLHGTYTMVEEGELGDACDLLVVLGGDGTLLAAARTVAGTELPLLGVNLGALGFLTEVRDSELFATMESVLEGRYELEPRSMLETALIEGAGEPEAARGSPPGTRQLPTATAAAARSSDWNRHAVGRSLNDAVVHAGASSRLLDLAIAIDRRSVGKIRADGLIVSTPTGSTAYSLSAGGPLVRPTIPAFLATPICPHSLSVRPLLFDDRETLYVRLGPPEVTASLALDGQVVVEFQLPATVVVRKAPVRTNLVLPEGRSFYNLVGAKLRWGGLPPATGS